MTRPRWWCSYLASVETHRYEGGPQGRDALDHGSSYLTRRLDISSSRYIAQKIPPRVPGVRHLSILRPDPALLEVHLVDEDGAVPVVDLQPVLAPQHQQRAALHGTPAAYKAVIKYSDI